MGETPEKRDRRVCPDRIRAALAGRISEPSLFGAHLSTIQGRARTSPEEPATIVEWAPSHARRLRLAWGSAARPLPAALFPDVSAGECGATGKLGRSSQHQDNGVVCRPVRGSLRLSGLTLQRTPRSRPSGSTLG